VALVDTDVTVNYDLSYVAQVGAKPGKRLTGEQRREHLLEVAAEILMEQGFDAVTMEAVRERAGVSRGLTYTHFVNAEELVYALYERERAVLDGRLEEACANVETFDGRIRAAARAYFDFVSDRGSLFAMLQVKLIDRWSKASVKARLSRLFKYWSDEIEKELGVSREQAASLSRASLAASEALISAWRARHITRDEAERMCADFVLGGLRNVQRH
jgi:AcrR family transcriptional regulator